MYLKLSTPEHLIEVSQRRNVRITFWEKATLFWPRSYPHLGMGPVGSLGIYFLIIVGPRKIPLISSNSLMSQILGKKLNQTPMRLYQEHKVNISDFSPLYPTTNYPWARAVAQTRTTNISEVS